MRKFLRLHDQFRSSEGKSEHIITAGIAGLKVRKVKAPKMRKKAQESSIYRNALSLSLQFCLQAKMALKRAGRGNFRGLMSWFTCPCLIFLSLTLSALLALIISFILSLSSLYSVETFPSRIRCI